MQIQTRENEDEIHGGVELTKSNKTHQLIFLEALF